MASALGSKTPDGGWGWVVVFGAFVSIGFSYAFPKALTMYFKEIQRHFGVSYSQIAWVSSIMLAVMYAGGPLSSVLVNRYGSRPVVITGGLMCSVSMVAASFSSTITHLYICVGIVGGLGLSFNLQPSLTIIGKYFQVRRPIANGLAMAGSPVFLCTLAPLNQFLFERFGWRGSFFILGAMLLNCCVAGSLMRPLNDGGIPRPETNGTAKPCENRTQMPNKAKKNCFHSVTCFMDLSLFRHRGFIIYLIGNMLMFFGFFAPMIFLAPYAKHRGMDEYSAASLLSALALVDMFARPGTGLLANTARVRPRIQYLFSFAITYNGVCHLLCPLASGYWGLVVYAVCYGVVYGMVCALLFECLMDVVGPSKFSSAVGLVTIFECCPVLLGPPIAGALVDMFGDYSYMFYMCGSVMLCAGLFLFVMNYYNYRRKDAARRRRENGTELAERNVDTEIKRGDSRTSEHTQGGDGQKQIQGVDSGTHGGRSETEDIPV
ncbi:solute carrier family 16, member 7 (monocarboxylic acid transporter 2) [Silurus asotus]|uniref:Solute carrier family 16, member 7 (Monocarboxylic acid transporter 2) n=1 Tax=Silurus asotus TaxID=30991 RepID=A0AAD5A0A6_SILAS|nr:solute carrier family 16, member 7 (monocarboxylic acid transporter 2) [Silurus asotus]